MKILLTGARGFVGRNLSAALRAAGHQLKPVCRGTGIDFTRMRSQADWMPHMEGIDAVINAVGIIGERASQRFATLHTEAPTALFRACADAGVRRVVQISALGADAKAFSAYHLSKRAADECLRSLDLDWFVLRPSLIYGRAGASARLFMRLAALPWVPVIGEGQQKLQPIHIADVAATVGHCLTSPQSRLTLDLVGPQTFTFAEWLQKMRQAQGRGPAPLLHIPLPVANTFAHLGRHFSPMLAPQNLRMLQAGSCADHEPLTRFLGHAPLRAEPHLFFCDVQS